jgi:hypothetical protein
MVMYKENYGTYDSATHYKDGLAVLAVFFEVRPTVNHTTQFYFGTPQAMLMDP